MTNKRFVKGFVSCMVSTVRNLFFAVPALVFAVSGFAKMYEAPKSFSLKDQSQEQVQRKALPGIDIARLRAEDRAREKDVRRPGPRRFAVAASVSYTLDNSGTWGTLTDGRLWRLRIQSPGAKSMSLGITRFDMPDGAKLWIYNPSHTNVEGPYTARHRSQRGSLWTPVVAGDEIVVEVFVPTGVARPAIEIARVNQGYYGGPQAGLFGQSEGTCEIDVICTEGDPWRNQIRSVVVYTISNDLGTGACTGNLMNDTAADGRPFVLSANHCLGHNGDPASVVVYWNYQSATCGTHGPGSTADNQTGAVLRASYAPSDFALFELSLMPDPTFNVFYSGWDATGIAPTATVAIHHPMADVKAISLSNTAPQGASYLGSPNPAGNHWRVVWNVAGTEQGSSGACLFHTTTGRCIGQNHGGDEACTTTNPVNYYGKLSVSWTGGGTAGTRLVDWLDNANTGALTSDGDPHITTANGIHYDFQGAGEYVLLRTAGGSEIQTRQAPIATTFNPGPDPHDGLATCVSLNTAVAARVGTHRVTYEPNLNGVPDPSGLQLRVDGVLTTLGSSGRDLEGGGRIAPTSAPGGLEIDFLDNNVLFVTPGWWGSQGKWYLNVDVVRKPVADGRMGVTAGNGGAPAVENVQSVSARSSAMGLMGTIPQGSWLPRLPDGTSMGPMPASLHQRYVDLYQKFGDAWRVTDQSSLFDYAPGTSTGTFTMRNWPPENPPCTIPRAKPAQPAEPALAERACRQITGKNAHADCVFDVRVTGNVGFATTYLASQKVQSGASGTTPTHPLMGKLAIFLDLGAGIPQGTFSRAFDTGFSFNAGVERMINSRLSAEGIFGYHHFPSPITGAVNIYQFSANVKAYLSAPPHKLRPFLNGGIGAYKFSPSSSNVGSNVGGGVLYEHTPRFGLQASYNFHIVNTPVAATKFSTMQGGVRFVF